MTEPIQLPLTHELYDELNANLDTTWPHDPAVPELPPMPVTDDPAMNPNAFLWTHFDDNVYPPRVKGVPEPRTQIVTESKPIEVDVFWSMRSPYSYLVLKRLVWLNSNYNVNVNITARPAGGRSLDQGRQRQSRRPVWPCLQGSRHGLGCSAPRKVPRGAF